MDIIVCHHDSIPLDLAQLLDFDAFDFAHDVAGIARHMNRETAKLEGGFVPRCALREARATGRRAS